jgi:ankyrin repeat protein
MSLIHPERDSMDKENAGDRSPSNRSTLSSRTNRTARRFSLIGSPSLSIVNRTLRLQAGLPMYFRQHSSNNGAGIEDEDDDDDDDDVDNNDDDDGDADDCLLSRDNLRSTSRIIRRHHSRRNSSHSISRQSTRRLRHSRPANVAVRASEFSIIQAPPSGSIQLATKRQSSFKHADSRYASKVIDDRSNVDGRSNSDEIYGETLLHLTARLGHDEIMRLLINETSQASVLVNQRGQTPLLIAIECGSTSTATLLMESNPRSIVIADFNRSSVFHYACEYSNDLVLHRAITLSKRLHSTSDRLTVRSCVCHVTSSDCCLLYVFRHCVDSQNGIVRDKLHLTSPSAQAS